MPYIGAVLIVLLLLVFVGLLMYCAYLDGWYACQRKCLRIIQKHIDKDVS